MTEFRTLVVSADDNVVTIDRDTDDVVVAEPQATVVVDLALAGPPGPPGPAGPQGPPGDSSTALAYVHTQNTPAQLIQVIHGLAYEPAGVLCKEQDGTVAEPASISYPLSGVVEVTFGFSFSGTVRVS
jgi:hypothetical protein